MLVACCLSGYGRCGFVGSWICGCDADGGCGGGNGGGSIGGSTGGRSGTKKYIYFKYVIP